MALLSEGAVSAARGTPPTDSVCERLSETRSRILGTEIDLPLDVPDCGIVMAMFWADVNAARSLVADAGLLVPALLPGRTPLVLLGVKYRDSPLGDYGEAAILFPADVSAPRASFLPTTVFSMLTGKTPQFVYRMAVDQEFTMHAGRFLWGYPKYLAKIRIAFDERRAEARLEEDGELVFAFSAPSGAGGSVPETRGRNLTVRNGVARTIDATISGTGLAFSLRGDAPEVGQRAPLARELRALGLPKRPLLTASIRNARFRFDAPVVVKR